MINKSIQLQYDTKAQELKEKTIDSSTTDENTIDSNSPQLPGEDEFITYTSIIEDGGKEKSTIDDKKRVVKSDVYQFNSEEFFGEIIQVNEDEKTFIVKIDEQEYLNREAVFNFSDVDSQEIEKIKCGAKIIFIYGKQSINGTIYNFSKIYFRKQLSWTQKQIDKAKQEADILFSLLHLILFNFIERVVISEEKQFVFLTIHIHKISN